MASGRARAAQVLLALGLFVAGVVWMSAIEPFAWIGLGLAVVALVALGYLGGVWTSVLFALVLVPAALVADLLAFGVDVTRQDEYEPVPATPFVVVGMPIPLLLAALGVVARQLRNRLRARYDQESQA
jgi:hypothetical protein